MTMHESPTWSAWTPLGTMGSRHVAVCHVDGIPARLVRNPDGTFEGWVLSHYTRKYPTVERATNALVQCLYRYIGQQEKHLSAMREVLKGGLLPPVWKDEEGQG